jgi:hypothetical protein
MVVEQSNQKHSLQIFGNLSIENSKHSQPQGLSLLRPSTGSPNLKIGNGLHPSFEFGLAAPVMSYHELELKTKRIFSNFSLASCSLLLREGYTDTSLHENDTNLAEKETIIDQLKFRMAQRETAIKHLENLVVMQQKLLEENYFSLLEAARKEETQVAGEQDLKQVLSRLKQNFAARKKTREQIRYRSLSGRNELMVSR